MAKYPHRVFEIYDERSEAIGALTPKSVSADEAKVSDPLPTKFTHLDVARTSFVTHVRFKGTTEFSKESEAALRDDFAKLADSLDINSKVLLDFADVESFSPACIETLVVFNRKLRNRGSRTVLCCLAPDTRASFYPGR